MRRVIILKNNDGEYRVPGPGGSEASAYYTDRRDDAVGTAKVMYGADVSITFRRKDWDADTKFGRNPKKHHKQSADRKLAAAYIAALLDVGYEEQSYELHLYLKFHPNKGREVIDTVKNLLVGKKKVPGFDSLVKEHYKMLYPKEYRNPPKKKGADIYVTEHPEGTFTIDYPAKKYVGKIKGKAKVKAFLKPAYDTGLVVVWQGTRL